MSALAALTLSACDTDKLLRVQDPDVADPSGLQGKESLPTLLNGAIGDFQVAYSGSNFGLPLGVGEEGQINMSGLFTDEFVISESFPTRIEVDRREILTNNSTTTAIFLALARGRSSTERAAAGFQQFDPGNPDQALALSLAGFTYIMFGENYCSGVAYSTQDASGKITYGQPQTTEQTLQIAQSRFDEALGIATAATDDDMTNLASIGKGRALLDLGDFAGAAAAVANVPTDYVYLIQHSTNTDRQNNGVWEKNWLEGRWTVADNEGVNGLPFLSDSLDPRTPSTDAEDTGFDGQTELFLELKYPARDSDVPLATGVEARLIEAEAALNGAGGDFIGILNGLRSGAGLSLLVDPGSQTGRVDLLFKERAYWLWLTAHRLGDWRRLVRQYGRSPDTVYTIGDYPKGGTYGTDLNFPIPQDELNNPNVHADPTNKNCIDRNA